MPSESPVILATESPRRPMHLRYFSLLRANGNFRRLWLAQLVSETGDWFYSLAVYDLLLQLTNRGQAVGWAIIVQTLPWFLMTPLAGHIVDRFPRRPLMILADLARGLIVLGLLLARTRAQVPLVYLLLGLEVIFASVFEPARNALLPDLVSQEQILPANALSSATWSTALAIGAPLGGAVTWLAGRNAAFIINSLSFFASALLVYRIHARETHLSPPHGHKDAANSGLGSLRAGAAYLKEHPKVLVLSTAKTGVGILGGSLLLLAFFCERVFSSGARGAMAMGWLYAARGVGAFVGPLVGDFLTRGEESRMWKSISLSYFLVGVAYVGFGQAPNLALAALTIFFAHCGGSNVWVMGTTLLQINTDERYRGRVFSLDLGLIMLAVTVTTYLLGAGLDTWHIGARHLAALFGCVLIAPGLLWLPAQSRWGTNRTQEPEVKSQ